MKTMEKFEIGKAVAEQSEGRITLTVEHSIAYLRGEFKRADRQPIKYKNGGWKYNADGDGEFWTLSVGRIAKRLAEMEAEREAKPEPEQSTVPVGTMYVEIGNAGMQFYLVTRSNESSVWLRKVGSRIQPTSKQLNNGEPIRVPSKMHGDEIRKAMKGDGKRLAGGFATCEGQRWTAVLI